MEFRDILQTSNPFYQFQQTIGEGGQGMVCKAINDKGENFAIKIRKVNSHNQNSCLREVKANARLRNTPGIVHFYESFVESDGPNIFLYLVFEFVEGKDLLQMMQDRDCGPMSEEQAREIFQQLVQAVKTCHKNGIVHRDLKPENIIIDYEGQVKLIDFGLCQMDASGRMCDDRTCTLQYSSPEMISEKFYDGELADVWSLGNILYILLTGVIPFSKEEKKSLRKVNRSIQF